MDTQLPQINNKLTQLAYAHNKVVSVIKGLQDDVTKIQNNLDIYSKITVPQLLNDMNNRIRLELKQLQLQTQQETKEEKKSLTDDFFKCDISSKYIDVQDITMFESEIQDFTINNEFKASLPINLYNKNTELKYDKYIHGGSHGSVFRYGNINDGYVALKVILPTDREIKLLPQLDKVSCGLIGVKYLLTTNTNAYVVLVYADGSLETIKDEIVKYTKQKKFSLVIKLWKYIKCLKDRDFCYTDLKFDNILFKCSNKRLDFYLGDLGSIYECDDSFNRTFTYPFPPIKDNLIQNNNNHTIWGMFVITMLIYCDNIQDIEILDTICFHKNINTNTMSNLKTEIGRIWGKTNKKLHDIFSGFLVFSSPNFERFGQYIVDTLNTI